MTPKVKLFDKPYRPTFRGDTDLHLVAKFGENRRLELAEKSPGSGFFCLQKSVSSEHPIFAPNGPIAPKIFRTLSPPAPEPWTCIEFGPDHQLLCCGENVLNRV